MWLRVDAGLPHEPWVLACAAELGRPVREIVGAYVLVSIALATVRPDGRLQDVPSTVIAGWSGLPPNDSLAFQVWATDDDGYLRGWATTNGKHLKELEANRERVRTWRQQRAKAPAKAPAKTPPSRGRTAIAKGDVQFPAFTPEMRSAAIALWAGFPPARILKVVGPLAQEAGAEGWPALLAQMQYARDFNSDRTYPPEWFVQDKAYWQRVASEPDMWARERMHVEYTSRFRKAGA